MYVCVCICVRVCVYVSVIDLLQALATSSARKSSVPYCILARGVLRALITSSAEVRSFIDPHSRPEDREYNFHKFQRNREHRYSKLTISKWCQRNCDNVKLCFYLNTTQNRTVNSLLGKISRAFSAAISYPSMTSVGESPILRRSSACSSNAPARIRTKLVPSPTWKQGK